MNAPSSGKYLFVGGPARSGTTAFVRLMNCHPHIALGIERYKYLYSRGDVIEPRLFESDRFLSLDAKETNVPLSYLGDLAKFRVKLNEATYRGDKKPHIMGIANQLSNRLPDCRFIVMHRNIYRICSSWNVRAHKKSDSWESDADYRQAAIAINRELGHAVDLQRAQPARCLIVRYENIFGRKSRDTLAAILDWLQLPHDAAVFAEAERNLAQAAAIEAKPLVELHGQREFLEKHIDWVTVGRADTLAV